MLIVCVLCVYIMIETIIGQEWPSCNIPCVRFMYVTTDFRQECIPSIPDFVRLSIIVFPFRFSVLVCFILKNHLCIFS